MDRLQSLTMFLAIVAALLLLARRRAYGWRRWAKSRVLRLGGGTGWGTIYVFRDRANSRLVKVGTTRRLSKTRKCEVSRTMADGADLVQVYAVDMPFARAVETLAHRNLRRRRANVGRGREWFWAAEDGGIEHIVSAIRQSASEVRAIASRRNRWPADMDTKAREVALVGNRLVKSPIFAGISSGS